MNAIEIAKSDFMFYDADGYRWYNTDHEKKFSDATCEITLIKETWNYCPECGRNISIEKSKH